MATYEAQCSKVGSFTYASNFKLYVVLSDGEVSGNLSKVIYNVYCQSSGSGSIDSSHYKYFSLNGQEIINTIENVNAQSPNAFIHIASGTTDYIEHDANGNKTVNFIAEISANNYGVSAKIEGSFNLTYIQQKANFEKYEVKSSNLNTIDIYYKLDKIVSEASISVNDSNYMALSIINGSWDKEATARIYNLNPNTEYKIKMKVKVNNIETTTQYIYATTKDIAKITILENFIHGNNIKLTITNPAIISNLNLAMKVGNTQILSRTVTTGNNIITFSDTELDNLYKKYGNASSLTVTCILTGSGYINSKTCTVTLKRKSKNNKE